MSRNYNDYQHTPSLILMEVAMKGKSEGWCGDFKDFENVKEKLAPFNVVYTCDFKGVWQLKK